jgi:cytidine deaminase
MTLDHPQIRRLINAAREGSLRSFLTKPGGTRYGAAVLTAHGRIFCSGQYSSFNHITNIHAEMAAVLMATMSGEPDIAALALVSTSENTLPARPCGVCREFLHEHALRTGRPMDIVMSTFDGDQYEQVPLDDLLPKSWSNRKQGYLRTVPWGPVHPYEPGETLLSFGDQVQIRQRFFGIVWEPAWKTGQALVKVKYQLDQTGNSPGSAVKMAHSFTEQDVYQEQIKAAGLGVRLPWDGLACIVSREEIQGIRPLVGLVTVGLAALRPLTDVFAASGIPLSSVSITGSWACGLQKEHSDVDMVITASPDVVRILRRNLSLALREGTLAPPQGSGTWNRLRKLFGQPERLVREGRFVETFLAAGEGRATRCSLIYVRPQTREAPILDEQAEFLGIHDLEGTVVQAEETHYKRARYILAAGRDTDTFNQGDLVEVWCWHKLAGLLRDGDQVRIAGPLMAQGGERRILQLDPVRHGIAWLGEPVHATTR